MEVLGMSREMQDDEYALQAVKNEPHCGVEPCWSSHVPQAPVPVWSPRAQVGSTV